MSTTVEKATLLPYQLKCYRVFAKVAVIPTSYHLYITVHGMVLYRQRGWILPCKFFHCRSSHTEPLEHMSDHWTRIQHYTHSPLCSPQSTGRSLWGPRRMQSRRLHTPHSDCWLGISWLKLIRQNRENMYQTWFLFFMKKILTVLYCTK